MIQAKEIKTLVYNLTARIKCNIFNLSSGAEAILLIKRACLFILEMIWLIFKVKAVYV